VTPPPDSGAADRLRPQPPAQDAPAKAREAAQPHASDQVAGLPSRDLDTARQAFGKDPS
jgi:hypothetical protein